MKISSYFILFLFTFSCIEPYQFKVDDKDTSLVIEAYLSDRSFADTQSYPSDGRYPTVKLTYTSDVTNTRPEPVADAFVSLIDDKGEQWQYDPATIPGLYFLNDQNFRALPGVQYKLRINIGELVYESGWEQLPDVEAPPIGEVSFKEETDQVYVIEASEPMLRTIDVVTASIGVEANSSGEIFYRWQLEPMWIYRAPLSPSVLSPGHVCWVTDPYYLKNYALQVDRVGGYRKELFTIPTVRNERIFEEFSVLVIQHVLTKDVFSFFQEMQEQNGGSSLIDKPPFNLKSNFSELTKGAKVSGYFGVVKEQAVRWYFNIDDLSYTVKNTLKADCMVYYGPPLPGCPIPIPAYPDCECKYCPDYSKGTPTETRPSWWGR